MPAASQKSGYSSSSQESLGVGVGSLHQGCPEDDSSRPTSSDGRWQQFMYDNALPSKYNPGMFQEYSQSLPSPYSPSSSQGSETQEQSHEGDKQPQPQTLWSGSPYCDHNEEKVFEPKNDPPTISQAPFVSRASQAGLEAAKGAAKWARSLWPRSGSDNLPSTGTAEQPQNPDISDRGTAQSLKSQKLPCPQSYDRSEQASSADRYSGDESD